MHGQSKHKNGLTSASHHFWTLLKSSFLDSFKVVIFTLLKPITKVDRQITTIKPQFFRNIARRYDYLDACEGFPSKPRISLVTRAFLSTIVASGEANSILHLSGKCPRSYGRVGLRRQIKVLVRKGVGSNPTVDSLLPTRTFLLSRLEIFLRLGQFI